MILQEMDALAGDSCYKYVRTSPEFQNVDDFYLVTASVDSIRFAHEFSTKSDLRMTAYPIWNGTSSLISTIDFQVKQDQKFRFLGNALFVFVARRQGSAMPVPKLDLSPATQEDAADLLRAKQRFVFGEENAKQRRAMAKHSLLRNAAPKETESRKLHELFANSRNKRATPSSYIEMAATEQETTILMHGQERNRHGNIFGGFLMRQAFEQAWGTVHLYAGGAFPDLLCCDESSFIRPVHIGDTLSLRSKVVFSTGRRAFVFVRACTGDKGKYAVSNELRYVFEFNEDIPQVLPGTYEEGLVYLEAQRRYLRHFPQ